MNKLLRALWVSFLIPILLISLSRSALAQGPRPPQVIFWSPGGLVAVERGAKAKVAEARPEALLNMLLEGPTPEERAEGLRSAIPPGTRLANLETQPERSVIVRLEMPAEALQNLSHGRFEIIVRQIGGTLESLNWRELHIQVEDPATGEFVPLASFLPELPDPQKEAAPTEESAPQLSPAYAGQPPAPGRGQTEGALSGKTVYVSAGHGWWWNGYVDAWRTQRPPYPNGDYDRPIIEDHNNAEAVDQYLLRYLWNAGAMVWPVRERDMNGTAVIVDNDDPITDTGYSETGVWTDTTSSGKGYAGTDYRYATTVTDTATATAVWTATLPADGRYAVYAWYRPGSNRAPDARYTVHHAGGTTEVIVNQRVHGNTWHYLGTHGFLADEEARVTLSNRSSVANQAVVADAVRFGGGTYAHSTDAISTTAPYAPDKLWWEVSAYYHTQRMGLNVENYPEFNDVIARPLYARWEHGGTGDDAVYISWHTNGYAGHQTDASGTESYVHITDTIRTEGSLELQDAIHTELIDDLRAGWDPDWIDRGQKSANFGELRELWDEDEQDRMPGVLVELAYHDHPTDTNALKEPTFNMLAARAMYQGIVKYFEQRDGIELTLLPEPPTHLAVRNAGEGKVRVSWRPSPTDTLDLAGDPATGYRVYTSTNGIGWSNGVPVTGTTIYTLTDLSTGQLLYVRVTATNAGGESFPTETLATRVGDRADVLLVNGFDRLNRTMTVADYDPVEGKNMRVDLSRMNRYDYAIQHGELIPYPFDSASNEAVSDVPILLGDYTIVDWILGEESASDETLSAPERTLLADFMDGGGALFISGSEIGRDLYHLGIAGERDFYSDYLRAGYVSDDAESYDVTPASGSIFEGLDAFRFDAPGIYAADYPDQITTTNGSRTALTYGSGWLGTAAVQYAAEYSANGCQRLVYLGFPFETIWPEQRPAVMARVMDFLSFCLEPTVNTSITSPQDGSAHNTLPPFEGTAGAGGTADIDRVEVQMQRDSDGYYFVGKEWITGTTWISGTLWLPDETWLTATGTVTWFAALPSLDDDGYTLRARAWTTAEVSDPAPAEVSFVYDTTPPTATTLITPSGRLITSAPVSVTLIWEPIAPDGGSSLYYRLTLDDRLYTTTRSAYTVTEVAEGAHTWGVQTLDAAGNRSAWTTTTFLVGPHKSWLPLVLRNRK